MAVLINSSYAVTNPKGIKDSSIVAGKVVCSFKIIIIIVP